MAVHVGLGWVPAGLPGKPGQVFCLFWCSMHLPLSSWLHDVGWDCGMLESHRNIVWYSGWHVGSPILIVADRQSAIYKLHLQTNLNGCFEGFSLAWLNGDTLLATGGGHLVEIGIGANRRAFCYLWSRRETLNDAELENTRHMYFVFMNPLWSTGQAWAFPRWYANESCAILSDTCPANGKRTPFSLMCQTLCGKMLVFLDGSPRDRLPWNP